MDRARIEETVGGANFGNPRWPLATLLVVAATAPLLNADAQEVNRLVAKRNTEHTRRVERVRMLHALTADLHSSPVLTATAQLADALLEDVDNAIIAELGSLTGAAFTCMRDALLMANGRKDAPPPAEWADALADAFGDK